jgi:hypothetical protein
VFYFLSEGGYALTIVVSKIMIFAHSSLLLLFSRFFGETITRAASACHTLNEDALFNKVRDIAYRSESGTLCGFLPFFCGKDGSFGHGNLRLRHAADNQSGECQPDMISEGTHLIAYECRLPMVRVM